MQPRQNQFYSALFAVSVLIIAVFYGLLVRPWLAQSPLPLELIFLTAAMVVMVQMLLLGHSWQAIQQAISHRIAMAIPTILLLFAIGLLIGSWIVSGTIPMLVYYGLSWVSVEYFYLIAFVVPIGFSLCTGTSWGSIATIGLVLISVGQVIDADLAICTGAIVGGAYFGDKLSPLSDTTNIAAVAANVPLYSHIGAMMHTTLPSAILASLGFWLIGVLQPITEITQLDAEGSLLFQTQSGIAGIFEFSPFLLLPIAVILLGAYKRWPALPVLLGSAVLAFVIAAMIQPFDSADIVQTAHRGFNTNMVKCLDCAVIPEQIGTLFNRGGLYALIEPIVITLMVFIYVGVLDCINAVQTLVMRAMEKITSARALIAATLGASALTNAMTSSQYANSFIVSQAFADKYDQLEVKRKYLSRSLEDTGTMIESIVPWTTTAVFVYSTLGVSVFDYWQWQLLSLANIFIAFGLAYCYNRKVLSWSSVNG